MFQAYVSISACSFYVFMNIYTGYMYVCINGHTAELNKLLTYMYLPYFSVARPIQQQKNWALLPGC